MKQNTVIDIYRVIKIETHVQELANETQVVCIPQKNTIYKTI